MGIVTQGLGKRMKDMAWEFLKAIKEINTKDGGSKIKGRVREPKYTQMVTNTKETGKKITNMGTECLPIPTESNIRANFR